MNILYLSVGGTVFEDEVSEHDGSWCERPE